VNDKKTKKKAEMFGKLVGTNISTTIGREKKENFSKRYEQRGDRGDQ